MMYKFFDWLFYNDDGTHSFLAVFGFYCLALGAIIFILSGGQA